MSDYEFWCPNCGQKMSGDPSYRGKRIVCPACQRTIAVPIRSVDTVAPPRPPLHRPPASQPRLGPRARLLRLRRAAARPAFGKEAHRKKCCFGSRHRGVGRFGPRDPRNCLRSSGARPRPRRVHKGKANGPHRTGPRLLRAARRPVFVRRPRAAPAEARHARHRRRAAVESGTDCG